MYPVVGFDGASLAMYPVVGFDGASLAMHPLAGFDGAPLAICPSVGFASQAQGYVSKERLSLSDATSEALARRLPKICGVIFLSVSL